VVAVLDGGRVVDRGRHEELLARCSLYARLWAAHGGARQDGAAGEPLERGTGRRLVTGVGQ
jgi:ATP-binding cassette subfamily B protein